MKNLSKEQIKRRPFIAALFRRIFHNYSTCRCCGLPWRVATPHPIHYRSAPGFGFFAVCEYCWQHKPLSEIEEATRKLHEDRLKRGSNRDLNEMIEETRKDYDLQNRHQ